MFQIKDFRSIAASMINLTRAKQSKITDFSVGSVARTMLESPAMEIEELYLQMFIGLQEAIPAAIFLSFDFSKIPALGASGLVRFEPDEPQTDPIVIPAGTIVRSSITDYAYATQFDATLLAGESYVDVMVTCTSKGADTNCMSQTLTVISGTMSNGIARVTNLAALVNGHDEESDPERKIRFRHFISTLSRGTISALEYGARLSFVTDASGAIVERVMMVRIFEPYLENRRKPVGLVTMYIHNGSGSTTKALTDTVKRNVDGYRKTDGTPVPGWKAAGVIVEYYAAQEIFVNVIGVITVVEPTSKTEVIASASSAIREYIIALNIGEPVIHAELVSICMSLYGVVNVIFSNPDADFIVDKSQKAMPDLVTLT